MIKPLLLLALLALPAVAQQNAPPVEEKGPYLGVLFSPLPEALLDHLPQLPRDGGVLITHVLPESPAALAGLRKHDILLNYNADKVRDANHLVRLIQGGKPGQSVRLGLFRAGRELSLEVKLALGPMLKVAKDNGKTPPAMAKAGGPPAVRVTAVPMEGDRLQVTFEYSELGRIRTVSCAGNANEIDREIAKLPLKVQSMARLAVRQLRDLGLQKNDDSTRPR
jgi:hypothetical protein